MVFIHRSTDDEASRPIGAHGLWGKAKDTRETKRQPALFPAETHRPQRGGEEEEEGPKSASSDVRVGSHARTAASPGLWRRLDSRQSVQRTELSPAQRIWLVRTHAPTDEQMMISMASRDGNELRRDVVPV
ncbi:hypothetical protein CDEST_11403 [Colletotrichum destructivum]|uniref:Uncharacterized protein n=1 Tax=Colletotrichum destructivum TaxID=34406 RepID=A0AAX4IT41_9PEZI|nr:hypothetical protein CDEST_11403 [Colletotrichum destructivum]